MIIKTPNFIFWNSIKNFTAKEFNSDDMSKPLVLGLQQVRDYTGRKIKIKSGYRAGDKGLHGLKMAADISIEGLHVVDQFLIIVRFNIFTGIGIYPNWNEPGLHVDVRHKSARWGSLKPKEYVELNLDFFKKII